ncbi:MAG: immunity 53 family protein [Leptospiraceae bacterium]|nr:immunity 53 family protein [Leptospiraceae bacterium]MCP5503100.1 immunity 53 family protein [Leptospiraceae bacterium]
MNTLQFIQDWYYSQCNGDREHSYGILIKTIDNPGWHVEIDLQETEIETLNIPYELHEQSEEDWYTFEVKDKTFKANGDPTKLEFLLEKFKELTEKAVLLDNQKTALKLSV